MQQHGSNVVGLHEQQLAADLVKLGGVHRLSGSPEWLAFGVLRWTCLTLAAHSVPIAVEEEELADPTTAEMDGLTFVVEDDEEDTGAAGCRSILTARRHGCCGNCCSGAVLSMYCWQFRSSWVKRTGTAAAAGSQHVAAAAAAGASHAAGSWHAHNCSFLPSHRVLGQLN